MLNYNSCLILFYVLSKTKTSTAYFYLLRVESTIVNLTRGVNVTTFFILFNSNIFNILNYFVLSESNNARYSNTFGRN